MVSKSGRFVPAPSGRFPGPYLRGIIMAKKATTTLTLAEQQQLFVRQVHTDAFNDALKKLGGDIKSMRQRVKLLGDIAYKNGGRYAHYVNVDGAKAAEKALTAEMVRDWKATLVSGMSKDYPGMTEYKIDKTVYSKMKDGPEKDKVAKGRVKVTKILSKYMSEFVAELALHEGIVIEPVSRKSKSESTGTESDSAESVAEKTALQQFIDALNNAARYGRKDDTGKVTDADLGVIYALIGKVGGTADFDAE